MVMEIRPGSILFSQSLGSGPGAENSAPLVFPCPVLRSAAGITNGPAQCLPDDYHLGQLRVQLSPTVMSTAANVSAAFGLRAGPGDWEDDACTANLPCSLTSRRQQHAAAGGMCRF